MSWLQKLHQTYEAAQANRSEGIEALMPIAHTTQQAHIEIVLGQEGHFRRASVIDKHDSTTLVPCTEESGGRAGSKPVPHPLCDKLQYIAGDFLALGGEVTSGFANDPGAPHRLYKAALGAWSTSRQMHRKLDAIWCYVQRGTVVQDLINVQVLPADADRMLLKEWNRDQGDPPPIFKLMLATQAPENAFVRWVVEGDDEVTATWKDRSLISSWVAYYAETQSARGYCMALGQDATLAVQHPAKLRNSGDKAKLISANDTTGYTYRGRFVEPAESVTVGYEVTQKAHNALRWLIARQGSRNGDQAIVAWAISGAPIPDPMSATFELLGLSVDQIPVVVTNSDVGQAFALQLKKAVNGFSARLTSSEDVIVMALDSATPGRLAIVYYREIKGSEFLARIEAWHSKCAWSQYLAKGRQFAGAPSPKDIAQAAYGRRLDEKLEKAARERLLPCIVEGTPIPVDLAVSTYRRVTNRIGADAWEWEKSLGIACALYKGSHPERKYQMTLEPERTSRDYLFGRLLAIADFIEGRALHASGETRSTTAARLMQRFADRPAPTWRNIDLALVPYKTRLRNARPGMLLSLERQIDQIMISFEGDAFMQARPLNAEFLLGFHCQRQALWNKPVEIDHEEAATTTN